MQELRGKTIASGLRYGEGPRWHDDRLWVADVHGQAVVSLTEDGQVEAMARVDHPSGLGWLPDGRMVVSTLLTPILTLIDPDGTKETIDLSQWGNMLNDLVVGPDGTVYVDVYQPIDPPGPPPGVILKRSPDGDFEVVASGLATPNGLAITPDRSRLIVSETYGNRLLVYPIRPDGTLGPQKVFADLGPPRTPDGLCLDEQGGVWVGCVATQEFLRVLEGGEITHRVTTDRAWAVATALGGVDRKTLFMIASDTSNEGLGKGESESWVEAVQVDVPGAGWP